MTIEDAIAFAARKHKGQPDKAGKPYIWHPLRVALQLDDERAQLAAVLHDVIEDSGATIRELARRGVPADVLRAVSHLTKRPGEKNKYLQFIRRVKRDPIARLVKGG
jgi:guanosine-3',5'-bis(diphosphate) 3'-pyrophosphohydrolase